MQNETKIEKVEAKSEKVEDVLSVYEDIDLDKYEAVEELEKLGLEHLKHCLKGTFVFSFLTFLRCQNVVSNAVDLYRRERFVSSPSEI